MIPRVGKLRQRDAVDARWLWKRTARVEPERLQWKEVEKLGAEGDAIAIAGGDGARNSRGSDVGGEEFSRRGIGSLLFLSLIPSLSVIAFQSIVSVLVLVQLGFN